MGEGWPKAGVRSPPEGRPLGKAGVRSALDSLPRAWWPAIEEARETLAREEGWLDGP